MSYYGDRYGDNRTSRFLRTTAAGALIGAATGNTGRGAAIGAAAGLLGFGGGKKSRSRSRKYRKRAKTPKRRVRGGKSFKLPSKSARR